jgi:hypothetical protein
MDPSEPNLFPEQRARLSRLEPDAEGRDWPVLAAAIEILFSQGIAGPDVAWAEAIEPPTDPDAFARETIFVIANSGMRHTVARGIFERVMKSLDRGGSAHDAFGHRGKAAAMDRIWAERDAMLAGFHAAADRLAYCETIPWIGGITKYHLAKNFGVDVVKPDVHLVRLANAFATSPDALCGHVAAATGWRLATVDTLLWRACATGVLCGRSGRLLGTPALAA